MSQVFSGNSDRHSIVFHRFLKSFTAAFVKIHPKSWYSWISMRVELFGCTSKVFFSHLREEEYHLQ